MSKSQPDAFQFLKLNQMDSYAEIILNRPDKANALNETMWFEIGAALQWADETPAVRAVLLRGEGSNFCAGIDLEFVGGIAKRLHSLPEGRKQDSLRTLIRKMQDAISAVENCRKPVIAIVHGACYGAGVDLIAACDIRHASPDATFSVKEVDLAIVADIGTLQRLPRIVGEGVARELALTARTVPATEALQLRLINQLAPSPEALLELGRSQAAMIAQKSPLAVRGTKQVLNYSRDHSVQEGLEFVANWNAGSLLSQDLQICIESLQSKKRPVFPD